MWTARAARLIDTLHRCSAFPRRGRQRWTSGYLGRSDHGHNKKLWTVAQAISEVLPDGHQEEKRSQGLLNQQDKVEDAVAEETLF